MKTHDDITLRAIIAQGQPNSGMSPFGSAFGGNLEDDEIDAIVAYLRTWEANPPVDQPLQVPVSEEPTPTTETPVQSAPTFVNDILPIFKAKCLMCHGSMGGWNGENYQDTIASGDHGPSVIPGDVQNSLLAQKIQGTQTQGINMPPGQKLSDSEIKLILDWILAGALEK